MKLLGIVYVMRALFQGVDGTVAFPPDSDVAGSSITAPTVEESTSLLHISQGTNRTGQVPSTASFSGDSRLFSILVAYQTYVGDTLASGCEPECGGRTPLLPPRIYGDGQT